MHNIKECDFCSTRDAIQKVIGSGTRDEIAHKLREIENRMWESESDNDYYKCLLAGEWPSSIVILERALEKAHKIEVARIDAKVAAKMSTLGK